MFGFKKKSQSIDQQKQHNPISQSPATETKIKKFNIPCYNNGQKSVVGVYLGSPKEGNNPAQHQAHFLAQERGITITDEVLETLEKIRKIASRNGVSFTELCDYAFKSMQDQEKTQ